MWKGCVGGRGEEPPPIRKQTNKSYACVITMEDHILIGWTSILFRLPAQVCALLTTHSINTKHKKRSLSLCCFSSLLLIESSYRQKCHTLATSVDNLYCAMIFWKNSKLHYTCRWSKIFCLTYMILQECIRIFQGIIAILTKKNKKNLY